jgi:chemotaxis protein histidine kinase CheA
MRRALLALTCLGLTASLWAAGGVASATSPAASGHVQPNTEASTPTKELGVYQAYEEAQRLEAEIVQMYREIRAAELARIQRQTFERSLESTLMPLSKRAQVDAGVLTKKAADAEAVKRYQEELSVVMRETNAIVSNAQSLLESLLGETEAKPAEQPKSAEEEEQETQAAPESEPRPEEQQEAKESRESKEAKAAREKRKKEEREKTEKAAREALEKTEMHLEKALEEIKAAREETAQAKKETREALEKEKAKAPKEKSEAKEKAAEKKLERLEKLETQIDTAEEKVETVIEKVKKLEDVSKAEVKEAEEAVEAMREAMKSVKEADQTAKKEADSQASEKTKEKTSEAVRQMEQASSSLDAAANAIKSLNSESDGDGGDGDSIAQIQALAKLAEAGSGKWVDLTDQMRGDFLDIDPGENPSRRTPGTLGNARRTGSIPLCPLVLAVNPERSMDLYRRLVCAQPLRQRKPDQYRKGLPSRIIARPQRRLPQ